MPRRVLPLALTLFALLPQEAIGLQPAPPPPPRAAPAADWGRYCWALPTPAGRRSRRGATEAAGGGGLRAARGAASSSGGGGDGRPVALVTGAGRGLGRAMALEIGRQGHAVVVACRDPGVGRELVREMRGGGLEASSWELDVASETSVRALVDACSSGEVAVPDLLVNNAGVCFRGSSLEVLERTLAVNYHGPERLTRMLLPLMRRKGRGVSVINVSSGEGELVYLCEELQEGLRRVEAVDALQALLTLCMHKCSRAEELAFGDTPAYSVSKAALNALTRIMAASEEAQGVGIRAVCPGDVDTPMCFLPEGSDVLSPEEAARDVVWVGLNSEACPSGRFYRARELIEW